MNTATFNTLKGITTSNTTGVYEVKIGNRYKQVRATSIKSLNDWCKENNVSDWRMTGMMSRAELLQSQNLIIVS